MTKLLIDREIVEQALDALEHLAKIKCDHGRGLCACEYREAATALRTALEQPAPSVEPVSYEYQTRCGKWSPFINKKHYEDTVADGSWPIRALYTSQPDTAAQIAELMKLCAEWKAVSDKQSAQVTKLQAKLDVAREALEEIEYNGDPIAIKALAEIEAIK